MRQHLETSLRSSETKAWSLQVSYLFTICIKVQHLSSIYWVAVLCYVDGYIISFDPHSIFQMRQQTQVKCFAHGHTTGKCQKQELMPS